MELDILKKAAEILKKDLGINQRNLPNREKTILIDALRTKYPLNDLLEMTGLSKNSYYYQKETQKRPDKYANLRTEVKEIFYENQRRYGYRRVHATIGNYSVFLFPVLILLVMPYKKLFSGITNSCQIGVILIFPYTKFITFLLI